MAKGSRTSNRSAILKTERLAHPITKKRVSLSILAQGGVSHRPVRLGRKLTVRVGGVAWNMVAPKEVDAGRQSHQGLRSLAFGFQSRFSLSLPYSVAELSLSSPKGSGHQNTPEASALDLRSLIGYESPVVPTASPAPRGVVQTTESISSVIMSCSLQNSACAAQLPRRTPPPPCFAQTACG